MKVTPIDRPADLGHLIRNARKRSKLGQAHLARAAKCPPRHLSQLELGLLTWFPVVTLELLRQRLELDPVEFDAYTGALWRDPPRGATKVMQCCGLRLCRTPH